MSRNRQWIVLSLLLIILGSLILAFKVVRLGFPAMPDMESEVWSIQARVELEPRSGPARVSMVLPSRLRSSGILAPQAARIVTVRVSLRCPAKA